MKIKNSFKFRLIVVISIIYVMLASSKFDSSYFEFDDFIWLTSPVWVFWTLVWLFPFRFEGFLGIDTGLIEKKSEYLEKVKLRKWVYVDNARAKTHKYYGSTKGWSLILSIGLVMSSTMDLATYYLQQDSLGDILQNKSTESQFVVLFKSMEISVWFLTFLSAICLYALWTHKSFFQKSFVIFFILEVVVTLFYMIAIGNMSEEGFKPTEVEIIQLLASFIIGVVWLIYIFRSKRINITTKNRLKNRDMYLLNED